jgi:ABC-type cobalt transport system substrate-binding protein
MISTKPSWQPTFLPLVEDGRSGVVHAVLFWIRKVLAAAFVYTLVCHGCYQLNNSADCYNVRTNVEEQDTVGC